MRNLQKVPYPSSCFPPMNSRLFTFALALLSSIAPAQEPVTSDLVIYGGTSAGVVAAVQAAKMGRTVALVEPGQHLGGMSVEGLGGSDIDNHKPFQNSPAVGGLTLQFYRKAARRYGKLAEFDEML